ncbi:autotransporter outer membrane beta-barrel domain-containing protein [Chelativorans sp. AA-79]|uniref:autotransporter outer membrane beta-barrel domain-containing protein n=1 Tax=Chelativorans sp. AA-79 TaxID=3028735 RepID=UPI0023F67537|nr:autotransporter outer membrane beta-barrel domain-containing protein [Chelativorans sp. AA-79]WEX07775.1 autotransporter outer membrane beta-barrel domain-containing protein [Chelativorans sp. AA-79]
MLGSTALAALLAAAPALAQDATWSGAAIPDDNYSTGGNWAGGTPSLGTGTATFGTSQQNTVTLDGDLGLGTFRIQDGQAYVFNKTGAGHVTLTGGMDIQAGSSATFNVSSERLHFLQGSAQTATINVLAGGMVEFQNLSNAGSATINNAGALNFWGSSQGGTAVITTSAGGVVSLNNFSSAFSAAFTFTDDGRLDISDRNSSIASVGSIASASAMSGVTLGSNTLAVGGNNASTTFAGEISGSGSLAKVGSGTLTLAGTNTYTGGTMLSGGALSISSAANLGDTSGIVFSGGALSTTATFTSDRNMMFQANGIFDTAAGTTFTASGVLSDIGGLIKNGAGTLTLTGNADYSGATRIMEGTLTLGSNEAGSGSSSYMVNRDATLAFADAIAIELGSLADGPDGGGEVLLGDQTSLQIGLDDRDTSFSGIISGPGGLWKQGDGWLTLTGTGSAIGGNLNVGASSTGGLEIAGGTFEAGDSVQIIGGNLIVSGGAKLNVPVSSTIGFVLNDGTVQVRGDGSKITDGHGTEVFSSIAAAELMITDGGVFETLGDATVRANAGSTSTAIIAGDGSQWQIADELTLGGPLGPLDTSGTVTVADGGTLAASLIDISAGSFLNIGTGGRAGAIEAGAINLAGDLVADFTDEALLDSDITGTGALIKRGTGRLVLTSDASGFSGGTTVSGGTLAVNGSLGGTVDVLAGGRLQGIGTVAGLTTNRGVIAPGNSIGRLTIDGDYVGDGGTIEIESVLGGDSSQTDLLVISGATSGSTNVHLINLGGTGAPTVEGIKIIDVGGVSDGAFALQGTYLFQGEQAVVAGAYAYRLYKNGVSDPTDGDWYLRSALISDPDPGPDPDEPTEPLYQAGVPIYEAYAGSLQVFNELGTIQQRFGNRSWSVLAQGADTPSKEIWVAPGIGLWAEIQGLSGSFEPETATSGADYDASVWKLKAGVDMPLVTAPSGSLIGGLSLHYGTLSADVVSAYGDGSIEASGIGAGGTLTWYGSNGFYVDGQAEVTWYDGDLHSSTAGMNLVKGNDGFGYALSIEAGKQIALTPFWSTTPQAQLSYSSVEFDDFVDPFGSAVSLDRSESLVGRLGITLDRQTEWQDAEGKTSRTHLYGIANIYYDFDGESSVDVAEVGLKSENQALWGGLGLGGSVNFAYDKYSVYGEALAKTSLEDFGDSHSIKGTLGFRVRW